MTTATFYIKEAINFNLIIFTHSIYTNQYQYLFDNLMFFYLTIDSVFILFILTHPATLVLVCE